MKSKEASPDRKRVLRPFLAAFTALAIPVALAAPASAAVGGSATAQAARVSLQLTPATAPGVPAIFDLQAASPSIELPAANGSNSSGVGVFADVLNAAVTTGAVNSVSTRSVDAVSASSSIDGTVISLFGSTILTADAVSSSATCDVDGTVSTSSEVVGLALGGSPVDLSVSPSATANVAVFIPTLVDASVQATVSRVADNGAGVAQGLNVTLSLLASAPALETEINVPLGSVVLAESTCTTPLVDPEAAPTLTGINPTVGPTAGGNSVTLSGTGFSAQTSVFFGETPAFVLGGDTTSLTVSVPASEIAGPVDVTALGSGGSSNPLVYTYQAPVITGVTPPVGLTTGGTNVTITGSGFTPDATVNFGGTPAAAVSVLSDTLISVQTPPSAAGTVDVSVVLPGLDAVRPEGFTFVEPDADAPVVLSVTPDSGFTSGGEVVTITGSGFTPESEVGFGTVQAESVTFVDSSTLRALTPYVQEPGLFPVRVTSDSTASNPLPFTFELPTLSSVEPSVGPAAGGTEVRVLGSGFTPDAGVLFGSEEAPSVTFVSASELVALTPPGAVGMVDVTVTLPGPDAFSEAAFTYEATPSGAITLTGVNPGSGPTGGGQSVTMTGSGFLPGASVSFGGVPAVNVSVVDANTITAVTPAVVNPGAVPVIVTLGDASTESVTYEYVTPGISRVEPNSGPTNGGTVVTIVGTGFLPGTTVLIGGRPATDVRVVDSQTLQLTTPSGAAGLADVTLSMPNGQSVTLASGYRYVLPAATPASNQSSVQRPAASRGLADTGTSNAGLMLFAALGLISTGFAFRRLRF